MATDGSTRAERERLNRILNDEEYGPKLVRLNKADQRTVLDLISANQGKQARAEILRLDEERRNTRRVRTRSWRSFAIWLKNNVDAELDVDEYVDYAEQRGTPNDFNRIADVIDHADDPEESVRRNAADEQPRDGFDYSPFWYHYYAF